MRGRVGEGHSGVGGTVQGEQWGKGSTLVRCTLHIGRAGVVRDGIGGAGSYHGRGELGRTRLHEHASIAMVPTISGWPPVSGHPAMVVAIIVQFGRAQEGTAW